MSRFTKSLLALALAAAGLSAVAAEKFHGVGRPATPAEIKAWDIDVRPDFAGLPKGSGTVAKGQEVWEAKCASCHGVFGESNEVFTPIIGGTTEEDIKTGRVAALATGGVPQRTTLMKVSTISTLWDYINRAMPWTAPKSLTTEEVYSVVAYILNLGDIVPADFTLSDANIREVQERMPNRNGVTRDHGLWETAGKPDVTNVACMKNCDTAATIASKLPDFARTAHGNLKEQNRIVGPTRGQDTGPAGQKASEVAAQVEASAALGLAKKHGCTACHGVANKIVGPGFNEIAARYKGDESAEGRLLAKVKAGGAGAWGQVPMPPQSNVGDDDIKSIVKWALSGAPAR